MRTQWRACPRFLMLLGLFALLSAADLLLTLHLLNGRVWAREGNPVANWALDLAGWQGLTAYKAGIASAVGTLAWAIASARPRAGVGVLGFGCAAHGFVVVYSCLLPSLVRHHDDGSVADAEAALHREGQLAHQVTKLEAYRAVRDEVIQALDADQCNLAEAVERLAATDLGRDPVWLKSLRSIYGVTTPRDCLAANLLVMACEGFRGDENRTDQFLRRWAPVYQSQFTSPSPPPWELVSPPVWRTGGRPVVF